MNKKKVKLTSLELALSACIFGYSVWCILQALDKHWLWDVFSVILGVLGFAFSVFLFWIDGKVPKKPDSDSES